jgi:hypothetical protein
MVVLTFVMWFVDVERRERESRLEILLVACFQNVEDCPSPAQAIIGLSVIFLCLHHEYSIRHESGRRRERAVCSRLQAPGFTYPSRHSQHDSISVLLNRLS